MTRYYSVGGRRQRIEAEDEMSINYGPARTSDERLAQWQGMLATAKAAAQPDPEYIGYIERSIAAIEAE